ncbi:MAG: HU family DNA-binding protein [bacterium]|nr:HU family DNA-binding protein [bacterium]
MTKSDLVAAAAKEAGTTKAATEKVINALLDAVEGALVADRSVTLVGFGTFSVGTRQARKGRNPQTKKEIKIPAAKVAKFKPGKLLKESVNK